MQKLRQLSILLCILLLVGGCATVRVESEGLPIPNFVVRGNIPSTGMRVDSAFIRYYGQEEGDELLDMHEYLNPYAEKSVIKKDYLRSLVVSVHVFNPRKETYLFIVYHEFPASELGEEQSTERKQELLYVGNLSRKDFTISLPVTDGFEHRTWFELWSSRGRVIFQGLDVHYEVVG